MRRITVINQKGGVGKTTTVANLSAAAARSGRRVLAVDLDPQAHLSLHFGIELRDDQSGAYDVLTSSTPIGDVAIGIRDNVTLVPADIDLAGAEAELVSIVGREMILRDAVDVVDSNHDVMLIDCPPSLGVLTINALAAAEEVLIPLQAHFFALQGVSKLLDTVTLVRQRINPGLRVAGFVLCMHDGTTRLANEVVADLGQFLEGSRGQPVPWADARIYRTKIRRNIKLAESSSFGQTVFDYAPRSHGAADYAALAEEVFGTPGTTSPSHDGGRSVPSPSEQASGRLGGAKTCHPASGDAVLQPGEAQSPITKPRTTIDNHASPVHAPATPNASEPRNTARADDHHATA